MFVVEVKLWGRNDYREAQRQVASYWPDDIAGGAVVQIAAADLPDWPRRYRHECLEPLVAEVHELVAERSPVRARFRCVSPTTDGRAVVVEHFLLSLPRRG